MGTAPTQEKLPITTTPQELEATARLIYDCFNSRDLDRVAALVADDSEWLDVPTGTILRGPRGYLDYEQGWLAAYPDGRLEVSNVVCSGDLAVTEFIGRGTHDGPLMTASGETIQGTGKKVELRCVEVIQVRSSKIVRARLYYDAMSMLRQIGALK